MVAAMLVAVIVLQKPCASAVGRFVGGFDAQPDAPVAPSVPPPAIPTETMVPLTPGMTDDEIRRAIDEARAKTGAPTTPTEPTAPTAPGAFSAVPRRVSETCPSGSQYGTWTVVLLVSSNNSISGLQ
jgi:hypothetical protein